MKEEKLENDDLDSLLREGDASNNSFLQDANIKNPYDTVLRVHVKQELDDTLLKNEPFMEDGASNQFQSVSEDIKITMMPIIKESSKSWQREDFLETSNNTIPEDMNFDNTDTYYTAPVDLVEQESDQVVVKHEPFITDEVCTELQSDTKDIKPFTNPIIEENGKIWCREDSAETWNLNFVKTEISENFEAGNDSQLKKHKCHLCHYSSSFKGHLHRHINSVHLKLRNHKCHLCDYCASCKGDLERHIKSVHWKLKKQKCHLCDYTSSQKEHLQYHINSVHLKLKNHKCHLCDHTSSRKEHLQSHIKIVHLKMKNHKCHLCDHMSSKREHLQSHINSVHLKLKNHKCHLCDYICSRKSRLQKHLNTRH